MMNLRSEVAGRGRLARHAGGVRSPDCLCVLEAGDGAGAGAEAIGLDAEALQHGDEEIA